MEIGRSYNKVILQTKKKVNISAVGLNGTLKYMYKYCSCLKEGGNLPNKNTGSRAIKV